MHLNLTDKLNPVRPSLFIAILFGILLNSCGLGQFDNQKRGKARKKADALVVRIQQGDASDDFDPKYFTKTQVTRIQAVLHDSSRYSSGNATYFGDFYQTNVGKHDQISIDYKYLLKMDSVMLVLHYDLDDSVRLFHVSVRPFPIGKKGG